MSGLLRDRIRDLLDRLDGLGIDPKAVTADRVPSRDSLKIVARTCGDFGAICASLKVKADGGRLDARGTVRTFDAVSGDLLVVHHCFRHLDCWGSK